MRQFPDPAPAADRESRPANGWRRRLLGREPSASARSYIVATFSSETSLLRAVRELKQAGQPIVEAFTPYPIHELDPLLGRRRSRLGWATFAAALCGGSATFGFQLWTSAVSWPLNVGGKPNNSALAFVPVTFEITVLLAGLTTAAVFLWRSRLGPGVRPRMPAPRITDDRFALLLEPAAVTADAAGGRDLRQLLDGVGAERLEEVTWGW